MVQDTLSGSIVAAGWVSPGQWLRMQASGLVSLSPDPASEPVVNGPAWAISERIELAQDLVLLQTTTDLEVEPKIAANPFLYGLEKTLETRRTSSAEKSYTRSLLDAGAPKIGAKLREEAGELAAALADESDERVLSEAADVMYHLLVGLCFRRLPLRRVVEVLLKRTGKSGHQEKASRGQ